MYKVTFETKQIAKSKYKKIESSLKEYLKDCNPKIYTSGNDTSIKCLIVFYIKGDFKVGISEFKRIFKNLTPKLTKKELVGYTKRCELCNYLSVFGKFCYFYNKTTPLDGTCDNFCSLEKDNVVIEN